MYAIVSAQLGFRASFLGDAGLGTRGHGGPINWPVHTRRHSREPMVLELPVVRTGKTDLQCRGGSGFAALPIANINGIEVSRGC
jgi:hypothetical protein